jgi:hypothetical protein
VNPAIPTDPANAPPTDPATPPQAVPRRTELTAEQKIRAEAVQHAVGLVVGLALAQHATIDAPFDLARSGAAKFETYIRDGVA